MFFSRSLWKTWGVANITLCLNQAISRCFWLVAPISWDCYCKKERKVFKSDYIAFLPVSSIVSVLGIPIILWQAKICWATKGLVGAKNTTFPHGYHLQKLYITTAPINVFPNPIIDQQQKIITDFIDYFLICLLLPVGKQTKVLLYIAAWTMLNW